MMIYCLRFYADFFMRHAVCTVFFYYSGFAPVFITPGGSARQNYCKLSLQRLNIPALSLSSSFLLHVRSFNLQVPDFLHLNITFSLASVAMCLLAVGIVDVHHNEFSALHEMLPQTTPVVIGNYTKRKSPWLELKWLLPTSLVCYYYAQIKSAKNNYFGVKSQKMPQPRFVRGDVIRRSLAFIFPLQKPSAVTSGHDAMIPLVSVGLFWNWVHGCPAGLEISNDPPPSNMVRNSS